MELDEFFRDHPRTALAFSGGVDSAFLLYAAIHAGVHIRAYYVQTPFQPAFELRDAERLMQELHADMRILKTDILQFGEVAANSPDRCYHCKRQIFQTIFLAARKDGYDEILDGTNASDRAEDRPGMRALREMGVLSPLQLCGLTKTDIRMRSRDAGLFTWNKPAYACLATRIPYGVTITKEALTSTEAAENYLMSLGFTDFRVRWLGTAAKLQITENELPLLLKHRDKILNELKKYYSDVLLDLEART